MKILIVGINFSPEQIGIGPYTGEFASYLSGQGHSVSIVTAKPYYPNWRVLEGYRHFGYSHRIEDGISIVRCPLYVPARPTGLRRILHHLSFALAAFLPAVFAALWYRPQLVISVAPSLMTAPIVRLAGRMVRARTWLHIQDFEVEAAFATGLFSEASTIGRLAKAFEKFSLKGFSQYSSISSKMCAKLNVMLGPEAKVVEFRNWADIGKISPANVISPYSKQWDLDGKQVALYSGNIANKQGIGIIVQAARLLQIHRDLAFVICGEGPDMSLLKEAAKGLQNVHFHALQPREKLQDLLSLATVHLLPQLQEAADLVLPSKLTNMLASGRPIVATAQPGTGLAEEVEGCGIVTTPGEGKEFAEAIATIISSPTLQRKFGASARQRAEERWSKRAILAQVEKKMLEVVVRKTVVTSLAENAATTK
jgi:colanic acid biosynthesis glycosyl transferase WcaI